MSNKSKGKEAEEMATRYLENLGYEIVERNYRIGRFEIDIIALQGSDLLVFAEVKLRSNAKYGAPEESVSEKQMERIGEAAEEYMDAIHWKHDIRFDILSVNKNGTITHLKDAFV